MITIGIPTYKRPQILKNTLRSLQLLKLPSEPVELIVVDNNSCDETQEVCRKYLPSWGRYVVEKNQGVSYARNRVIAEARGNLIAFLDDDASPDSNWLLAFYNKSREIPQAGIFMGKTLSRWEVSKPWWFQDDVTHKIVFNYRYDGGDNCREIPIGHYPAGPNMAVRLEVFNKIGGFDPMLGIIGKKKIGGEEIDFAWRARRAGYIGYYVPEAIVYHRIHSSLTTFKALIRGSFAGGLSETLLLEKYPEQFSSETSIKFKRLPLWWWYRQLLSPFKNIAHLIWHSGRLETTAVVHHYLNIIRWSGRLYYVFKGLRS